MSDIQEEQKRQYKRAEENDIKLLQEENKKLKELCDKYEEEHSTTFEEWKKDIKANKKAIEYINSTGYGTDFSMSAEEVDKVLNILQGEQNE